MARCHASRREIRVIDVALDDDARIRRRREELRSGDGRSASIDEVDAHALVHDEGAVGADPRSRRFRQLADLVDPFIPTTTDKASNAQPPTARPAPVVITSRTALTGYEPLRAPNRCRSARYHSSRSPGS